MAALANRTVCGWCRQYTGWAYAGGRFWRRYAPNGLRGATSHLRAMRAMTGPKRADVSHATTVAGLRQVVGEVCHVRPCESLASDAGRRILGCDSRAGSRGAAAHAARLPH